MSRPDPSSTEPPHVVIVGGGFGGLAAARKLKHTAVRVTLIDRTNHHLFQPLLYQVATGALSPANIAAPLRGILRRHDNVRVLLSDVRDVEVERQRVLTDTTAVAYDVLIIATGVRHHYFGNEGWEPAAPGLKTIGDALEIRHRVLGAFEAAEVESDPERSREWLTFVVVGGGPTGVELAGALAEIAKHTLRHDFRSVDPTDARILLFEATERVLPTYPRQLAGKATQALARLGVEVRAGTLLTDVDPDGVTVVHAGETERIATRTVLWAAGVKASPLGTRLAAAVGAELDSAGRIVVGPDLTLPGHPEIFVIGDLARAEDASGEPLSGVAPVAIQQGRYVANLVRRRLNGDTRAGFVARLLRRPASSDPPPAFRYRDRGQMATIGRGVAVADLGRLRIGGFVGWVAWLTVHLMWLPQFESRLLILVQWAWSYWTWNRSARLIYTRAGRAKERIGRSRDED